jgi:Ser/Thr protein kinase RdoA (MazF antagonist)
MDKMNAANYMASLHNYNLIKINIFNAGLWLKNFQSITGIRQADLCVLKNIIERCDKRLRLIEEANHKDCPMNLRTELLRHLQALQDEISTKKVLVSGRHGDFGEWNIIARNEEITVIDFLGFKEEPVAVDVLKMLMNFENNSMALLASKNRITNLKMEFMKGYGEIPDMSPQVLIICEILHRLCTLEASVNEKTGDFKRRFELKRRFKHNLSWLMDDRGEKSRLWG